MSLNIFNKMIAYRSLNNEGRTLTQGLLFCGFLLVLLNNNNNTKIKYAFLIQIDETQGDNLFLIDLLVRTRVALSVVCVRNRKNDEL